jgi:hypothetical protein
MDTISDEAMLNLVKERLSMTMIHLPARENRVLTQLK